MISTIFSNDSHFSSLDDRDRGATALSPYVFRVGAEGESSGSMKDNLSLLLCISGSLELDLAVSKDTELKEGEWALVSECKDSANWSVNQGAECLVIQIEKNMIRSLAAKLPAPSSKIACLSCPQMDSCFFAKGESLGRISSLAKELVSSSLDKFSSYWMQQSRAYELVARVFERKELQDQPKCPAINSSDIQSLEKIAEYLELNLEEEHSLAGLSRMFYLNEFKLKKGFREHFGTTVFAYLRQKRMERANELLQQEDVSVIEVANEVGYSNSSHFARAFRAAFGQNPREVIRSARAVA